jgi:hypothetical protein
MDVLVPLPMPAYRPHRTRSFGVVQRMGWIVKLTGITADSDLPDDVQFEAAVTAVTPHLPQPSHTENRIGISFLIVHRGTEALWAILGWWQLDILYHKTFRADLGTVAFRPVPPDGPTACVWELLVIDHERRSWVTHVLQRPDDPDLAGYLDSTLIIEG